MYSFISFTVMALSFATFTQVRSDGLFTGALFRRELKVTKLQILLVLLIIVLSECGWSMHISMCPCLSEFSSCSFICLLTILLYRRIVVHFFTTWLIDYSKEIKPTITLRINKIYRTRSPSYQLLASIHSSRSFWMVSTRGDGSHKSPCRAGYRRSVLSVVAGDCSYRSKLP